MFVRAYNEANQKIRNIYFQIIKEKLNHIRPDYEEEYLFFMDLLDIMFSKDLYIEETMNAFKDRSKYYVNPYLFDRLMKVVRPEIESATKFQKKIHKMINDAKSFLQKKIDERNKILNNLESAVENDQNDIEAKIKKY